MYFIIRGNVRPRTPPGPGPDETDRLTTGTNIMIFCYILLPTYTIILLNCPVIPISSEAKILASKYSKCSFELYHREKGLTLLDSAAYCCSYNLEGSTRFKRHAHTQGNWQTAWSLFINYSREATFILISLLSCLHLQLFSHLHGHYWRRGPQATTRLCRPHC